MFDDGETRVLGVDPGIAALGLAMLRSSRPPEVVWSATIRTDPAREEAARLREVHDAVAEAINVHQPDAVAMERLMWGKNAGSAMSVARAAGVVLLAAAEAGLEAAEYAPLEVKMAAAGAGHASKVQVRAALAGLHGLRGVPDQADAADAAAVAFCHIQQAPLRARTAEASR